MPSLGSFNVKATIDATKENIESARKVYESTFVIDGKPYQFDELSKSRMKAVIASIGDESINWKLADNSYVSLTKEQLKSIYDRAESDSGTRIIESFNLAEKLKAKLTAGERVTLADLVIFKPR